MQKKDEILEIPTGLNWVSGLENEADGHERLREAGKRKGGIDGLLRLFHGRVEAAAQSRCGIASILCTFLETRNGFPISVYFR